MTVVVKKDEIMKFLNRSKHHCKDLCHLYKAPKTITAQGVINQFKCNTCNQYIFPNGLKQHDGNKICICCGNSVEYIESIKNDPGSKNIKKSIPTSFTKQTFGKKTFEQFLEFIEDDIRLQANYQLVVLKLLIGSKISEKIDIAEELAYQNNKNFDDYDELQKFLSIPVYDVLENRGFIKKITHENKEKYAINIEMNEFEISRSDEILEKKLRKFNLDHNIPENQFDSLTNNVVGSPNSTNSYTESQNTPSANELEPTVITNVTTNIVDSNDNKILFLEKSSNGILLKEYVETKSTEISIGQILSNDDLMDNFGVGNMGGIRYSKKNDVLVLCSSLSHDYIDSIVPGSGLIVYSGEGKIGNQEITRGNAHILNSKNKILFFKEQFQEPGTKKRGALDNLYEFVGLVNYVKHYWKDELDAEKNIRKVVKFVLEVEE